MFLPGLDFQARETLKAGVGENEKRRAHRLPHPKIAMWATCQLVECIFRARRLAAIAVENGAEVFSLDRDFVRMAPLAGFRLHQP